MNQSEMNFYAMLAKALPHHTILAQVSFNALITHGPWLENRYYKRAVRSKFNTKYVDFVICTKQELTVYAVVEYDGGGHNAQDDWTRDEMLRSAGYRVERFTSQDSAETILARFG